MGVGWSECSGGVCEEEDIENSAEKLLNTPFMDKLFLNKSKFVVYNSI